MKSRKKRTFTPEQKAKIVLELLKENKTIAELAAEYEIPPNQLQRWKSEATEKMHLIFTKGSDEVAKLLELMIGFVKNNYNPIPRECFLIFANAS
jgi:transposase-like protein